MTNIIDPQLDTKENQGTPTERLQWSYKRAKKFTTKRVQNLRYARDVGHAIVSFANISGPDYLALDLQGRNDRRELKGRLDQYHKNLCLCGGNSLYRRRVNSREATLITSLTCNHRLCNICNMVRAYKMRRKWKDFFVDEEKNVLVKKAQAHMFENIPLDRHTVTKLIMDEETGELIEQSIIKEYTSGADLLRNFDFMHLTLTVPHGPDGWNGQEFYAKELLQAFNVMRKSDWWVKMVFGGELSVETTRSIEGGLHIHIHALILVDKRVWQSRNKLHEHIMLRWNHLTIDDTRPESEREISDATPEGKERCEGIRNGLAACGDGYFNEFINALDGRGSTMIGIKSLYYEVTNDQMAERSKKNTFTQNGKAYSYASSRYPQSMVKGVMECLKYHFEPCVLEREDGTLDTDFLKEVLPNIYRQRLYGKFGGFYGVKQLNVAEEPLSITELTNEFAENAGMVAFDPKTGIEIDDREFVYVVADASTASFHSEKPLCYIPEGAVRLRIDADVGIFRAIIMLSEWGNRNAVKSG